MRLNKFSALIAAGMALVAVCCTQKPPQKEEVDFQLDVPKTTVDYKAGSQFLYVTAPESTEWTLTLTFGEQQDHDWLSVNTRAGKGSNRTIALSWKVNSGQDARTCIIQCEPAGAKEDDVVTLTFRQESRYSHAVTELASEPFQTDWLELPEVKDDDNRYFITHRMNFRGESVRNYSIYFDPSAYASIWVAYPQIKAYTGSLGRSNAWTFDPKVPQTLQANLSKSYSGNYDRGHQQPSADRTFSEDANAATFYFTNMTPQWATLNQHAWASLESKVRTWSNSMDTLYVVTGADFSKSTSYSVDASNHKCPIPNAYFKALLGYKSGSTLTGNVAGYVGIAFWYNHFDYSDNVMSNAITIDELEDRLGYDFFVNLPAKIGQENAASVEGKIASWWK